MKQIIETIQDKLIEGPDREVDKITTILVELKKAIQTDTKNPEYAQPSLFAIEEQGRFERNKDAMRKRLKGTCGT